MNMNLAELSKESLDIISEAEKKIASTKGEKIALVAYKAED